MANPFQFKKENDERFHLYMNGFRTPIKFSRQLLNDVKKSDSFESFLDVLEKEINNELNMTITQEEKNKLNKLLK